MTAWRPRPAHLVSRFHQALGQKLAKGSKADYANRQRSLPLQSMQSFGFKVAGESCIQGLRLQACATTLSDQTVEGPRAGSLGQGQIWGHTHESCSVPASSSFAWSTYAGARAGLLGCCYRRARSCSQVRWWLSVLGSESSLKPEANDAVASYLAVAQRLLLGCTGYRCRSQWLCVQYPPRSYTHCRPIYIGLIPSGQTRLLL